MNVPNWLWQDVVADLLTEGLPLTVWLAWKYREAILSRVRSTTGQPVYISGRASGTSSASGTATVRSERQILYNVEAPTPSFARRLEDLGSWLLLMSTS